MSDSTSLLLFMTAALALNVTPGPDMMYIVARSSAEGTRAGVVSALGIAAGSLVHLAAIVLGLASLLEAVPVAYDVVRYIGAAYLIFLGVRAILERQAAGAEAKVERAKLGRVFRQGAVTNILNPKVALFFAAFLPQFANPEQGSVAVQLIILGLLFNLSGTTVNLIVAYAAGRAGQSVRDRLGPAGLIRKFSGAVFILLGLRIALQRRG